MDKFRKTIKWEKGAGRCVVSSTVTPLVRGINGEEALGLDGCAANDTPTKAPHPERFREMRFRNLRTK